MSVSVHVSAHEIGGGHAFDSDDPGLGVLWNVTVGPGGVRLAGKLDAAIALRDALNDVIAQGAQLTGDAS